FEAEVGGGVNEAGFGKDAFGGEDAVDGAAKGGFARERLDFAVEPILEEEAADAVAGLEEGDRRADGEDLAGGVGAEDAREVHLGVVLAEGNHEVAVVECGGVEAHVDVGGAQRREWRGFEREVVEAEGVEAEGSGHGWLDEDKARVGAKQLARFRERDFALMPVADDPAYGPMSVIVPPDVDQVGGGSEFPFLTVIDDEEVLASDLERTVVFEHIHDQGSRNDFATQLRYVGLPAALSE